MAQGNERIADPVDVAAVLPGVGAGALKDVHGVAQAGGQRHLAPVEGGRVRIADEVPARIRLGPAGERGREWAIV